MAAESLTDFVEIVMGQSPPGDKVSHDTGVPLLNGPTEFGFHHPTPIQFTVDARKIAQPGDLLFCVRGSTTGRMNWAEQKYAIGRGVAAIRHRWAPKLQPFVRAVIEFELPDLLAQATGSTFPNVSASQLAAIPYPSLSTVEQHAIANILGTLDDKTELNRRMNETLEARSGAMARALFKDWFVDFGPTRAKMEGRDPYLAPELWDLFPDKLDEDGKPEGWEDSKVEDYLELAYGKSLPAKSRRPGGVAVYGSGGLTGFHDEALIKGPAVIVGRKGTVGSLYWEDRPIFPIDTVFYVVPKRASLSFCYQLLLSQPLAHMNTDAAVPGLNRNNAYRLEFPWPGSRLTNTFESFASPLWKKRTASLREIDTLSQSRDLLLPKLMSGKIRVGDADKIVQEST